MGYYNDERAALLAAHPAGGAALRSQLSLLADTWISQLSARAGLDALGACVVAVGGYGRSELAPGSDLDIVLLVPADARAESISNAADKLWYPIWDEGVRLDHSVRTQSQARAVATEDVKAMLGLLDARTIYGDDNLRAELTAAVFADWRRSAVKRLPELRSFVDERTAKFGELAHLLEPDLKESFGGLRDLTILRAIAASSIADVNHGALRTSAQTLLDVRDALHLTAAKPTDRLTLQEHAGVAQLLNVSNGDDLLRTLSQAARTIAYHSDIAWHRVRRMTEPRRRLLNRRGTQLVSDRTPLAEGVVVHEGEAVLARGAAPETDPVLLLRAAAAAAQNGLQLGPHTVEQLALRSAPMPVPWPRAARESLVSLLGAGRQMIPVWEALDQFDVWNRLIPGWNVVRSAPQHNPLHTFTVDRHLTETAAYASEHVRRVARPDLLLVGALLHDIGKAREGDHTDIGVELVKDLGPHLGFDSDETQILVDLVRHHLLLPDTATRRDPSDPATLSLVRDAVASPEFLTMLHALTEADSRATGPAVSSDWRLGLVSALVERVNESFTASGTGVGADDSDTGGMPEVAQHLVAGDGITVHIDAASTLPQVTVSAPDSVGLLATTAGVLALHRLSVRTASTQTVNDRAVSIWGVTPQFGEIPDATRIEQDLRLALEGTLDVHARLQRRRDDSLGPEFVAPAPTVTFVRGASQRATVMEVRAHDVPGLLHAIAHAISESDVDIVGARIATLGSEAIDVFYLVTSGTAHALTAQQENACASHVQLAITSL